MFCVEHWSSIRIARWKAYISEKNEFAVITHIYLKRWATILLLPTHVENLTAREVMLCLWVLCVSSHYYWNLWFVFWDFFKMHLWWTFKSALLWKISWKLAVQQRLWKWNETISLFVYSHNGHVHTFSNGQAVFCCLRAICHTEGALLSKGTSLECALRFASCFCFFCWFIFMFFLCEWSRGGRTALVRPRVCVPSCAGQWQRCSISEPSSRHLSWFSPGNVRN